MAVLPEYPWKDDNGVAHPELIGHRSDQGKRIVQVDTGVPYDYAVDPYPTNRSYIESEINIEDETPALQVEEK